ncbi:MAG: stage II sporulation protein D, partial [Actinobacteria bacterium]
MKRLMLPAAAVFILLVLMLPALLVWNAPRHPPAGPEAEKDYKIKMLDTAAGKVTELPLETYLVGVLAAEMPAEFSAEALKAQVLAARTYAAKRMAYFGAVPGPRHPEADICTNPVHCQAWVSPDTLESRWGKLKYAYYYHKIRQAVAATRGQVLTYAGQLIDPVYHGSCGRRGTEDAGEVWGREVPYLRGVECKWEADNPKNRAERQMTMAEVLRLIDGGAPGGKPEAITVLSQTAAGRLKEVKVGGRVLRGSNFRSALGLGSALVSWHISGDTVYFKT